MQKRMNVIYLKIDELVPYDNNPRLNDGAVEYVMRSIDKFGFRQPIVIDKDTVIVCGHTRYTAATKLGYEEVPCVMADDLSDEEIKAYRLADNKVAEFATWDFEKLHLELDELPDFEMQDFGFYAIVAEDEFAGMFEDEQATDTATKEEKQDEEETTFSVVVKFESEDEAKTFCADMQEQGYDCEVVQ